MTQFNNVPLTATEAAVLIRWHYKTIAGQVQAACDVAEIIDPSQARKIADDVEQHLRQVTILVNVKIGEDTR